MTHDADRRAAAPGGGVVAKAALLIVVVGATGIGLLTERQRRFEAAHAMTMAHKQADALEREIRVLRAEIADRLTPAKLGSAQASVSTDDEQPFRPILWTMGTAPEIRSEPEP